MKCTPHYIRCIKPNETKRPKDWEESRQAASLWTLPCPPHSKSLQCGSSPCLQSEAPGRVLGSAGKHTREEGWICLSPSLQQVSDEVSLILHVSQGDASLWCSWRQPQSKPTSFVNAASVLFPHRYAILTAETWPCWRGPEQQGVLHLLRSVNMDNDQYQMGTTKVFVKNPESVPVLIVIRYIVIWIVQEVPQFYICWGALSLKHSVICPHSFSFWRRWGKESLTLLPGSFRNPGEDSLPERNMSRWERKVSFKDRLLSSWWPKCTEPLFEMFRPSASDILYNSKERRKNSINRNFVGDYIGLEQKPELRQFLAKRERVDFADSVNKFDRRFKVTPVKSGFWCLVPVAKVIVVQNVSVATFSASAFGSCSPFSFLLFVHYPVYQEGFDPDPEGHLSDWSREGKERARERPD